jgi:hypothetical protein
MKKSLGTGILGRLPGAYFFLQILQIWVKLISFLVLSNGLARTIDLLHIKGVANSFAII